jgi:hypothetical protein
MQAKFSNRRSRQINAPNDRRLTLIKVTHEQGKVILRVEAISKHYRLD